MTPAVPAPSASASLAPVGLPRLLLGGPDPSQPMPLTEHLALHGHLLLRGFAGHRGPAVLIDAVERAGLSHCPRPCPRARRRGASAPSVMMEAAARPPQHLR